MTSNALLNCQLKCQGELLKKGEIVIKFARYLLLLAVINFYHVDAVDNKDHTLIIGSSLDLSRGIGSEGRAVQEGINAVFDHTALAGIQIKFDARNDEYMPEKALANVQSFIRENIDILLMPTGSATFQAYADLVKEGKIVALFPTPGLPAKHDPAVRSCIYLRPSYSDQATALARYIVNKFQPQLHKIILFYQDDIFGKSCRDAAKQIFEKEGITTIDVLYERNNMNLTDQVAQIKAANADAIGLFATAIAAKGLLDALGTASVHRWKLFAIDDVGQNPMKQFIRQKGISIVISNVVPNPETSDIELIKEYRARVKEPDTYSLEGYIGASILVDIVQHLSAPIGKEKIIDACEAIKDYKLKEFPLTFNSKKRQLINTIWINSGADEWEKIEIEK